MSFINLQQLNHSSNITEVGDAFVFTDYKQRIVIAFMLCVFSVIGTVGNTVVILAVALSRKLRSPTYLFITNLAWADLLTCILLPLHAVGVLGRNDLLLPTWICSGISVLFFTCQGASVMTLALIAFTRWYLLTKPNDTFREMFGKRNILVMLIVAWLYPLFVIIFPHLVGISRIGYSTKYLSCTYDFDSQVAEYYTQIPGVVFYSPMFTIIGVFYTQIYLFVSKHNTEMKNSIRFTRKFCNISSESRKTSSKDQTSIDPNELNTISSAAGTKRPDQHQASGFHGGDAPSDVADHSSRNRHDRVTTDGLDIDDESAPTSSSNPRLHKINPRDNRKSSTKTYRQQVRVTKRLVVVLMAFLICFSPLFLCAMILSPTIDAARPWAFWISAVSTCINPIIYARTMPVFREVMGCIIRCRFMSIPEPIKSIRRRNL